jgi:hypothetical protein
MRLKITPEEKAAVMATSREELEKLDLYMRMREQQQRDRTAFFTALAAAFAAGAALVGAAVALLGRM